MTLAFLVASAIRLIIAMMATVSCFVVALTAAGVVSLCSTFRDADVPVLVASLPLVTIV